MAILTRSQCGALMRAVFMLLAVAVATSAQAQNPSAGQKRLEQEVLTSHGKLEVYRLDRKGGQSTNQIALAGKVLFDEPDYNTVSIAASYPKEGPVRVVLLELATGGTGCPMEYKVVEVKDNGRAVRSKEFGNCAMAKSNFTDGVLQIDFPKAGGAAAESWRYQNGKLSKARKSPSPRTK